MIRAPIARLEPGERTLDSSLSHYLSRVLRLHRGDSFVAFDAASAYEADVEILGTGPQTSIQSPLELRVRIGPLREANVVQRVSIAWVQGFAKGDKCDAIVRDVTELGATRFCVAITERSVPRLDEGRSLSRVARWGRIASEASRQSGRGDSPVIDPPANWKDLIGHESFENAYRFCLHPRASVALADPLAIAMERGRSLAFAVGPEGGLTEDELALAEQNGWMMVSLGNLVLRTETVAAAVLGAVCVWRNRTTQGID